MIPYAEVIGDPIEHSLSPNIHNFWCEALGIKAEYRATRVRKEDLASYFEARRQNPLWRGCNITAPLKALAISHTDRLSRVARRLGAANCIVPLGGQLVGHNSDVDGIAEALGRAQIKNQRVAVIGAGGAARAAVSHLARQSPDSIRLIARDFAQARPLSLLAQVIDFDLYSFAEPAEAFRGVSLIVNATPLGMAGYHSFPAKFLSALDALAKNATVFDMVYEPLETELLRAAKDCRLQTSDGLSMLIGQAAKAFRLFFEGIPSRRLDSELRSALTAGTTTKPIVLVGMPGAGKTTIGRLLSERLGIPFRDSDLEIERQSGMSVSAIFEQRGAREFRKLERQVIRSMVDGTPTVIAVGGGALNDDLTFDLVRQNCTSVWLKASTQSLARRVRLGSPRPLLAGRDITSTLEELAAVREQRFASANIHIAEGEPEATIRAIIRRLPRQYAKFAYAKGVDADAPQPIKIAL